MTDFDIFDDRFKDLLLPDSKLLTLASGFGFIEGPAYFDAGYLIFSDIPANKLLRWSEQDGITVFREPSHNANGNTIDHQGRLLTCEHSGRRVSRLEADGTLVTVVDKYQGKRLNSPNDVVVKSDGTIWFTDPPYGLGVGSDYSYKEKMEIDGCYVYRFDPQSDELTPVVTDMVMPNGLAFSPDEQRLYVADSSASNLADGLHHIRVYDVIDGKTTANGRTLADIAPGVPDGFRLDQNGYLFITARDGVHVLTQAGELIGKIRVPETCANCTFGGSRLFITASTTLYAVDLNTYGR